MLFLSDDKRDFQRDFQHFIDKKRESEENIDPLVLDIIQQVRAKGDQALIALSQKFDHVDLGDKSAHSLALSPDEIESYIKQVGHKEAKALAFAANRIET